LIMWASYRFNEIAINWRWIHRPRTHHRTHQKPTHEWIHQRTHSRTPHWKRPH
jgi:hypothetical protein